MTEKCPDRTYENTFLWFSLRNLDSFHLPRRRDTFLMTIQDYIYVDEKRLDSYVEQIASPEVTVKTPVWTFGLSLAGPKVQGVQQQTSRNRTQSEKIELLLKHLSAHKELAEGRIQNISYFNHPPVFRIETCSVVSVYVPPLRPRETGPDALTLWISADSPYRLFLLQDFQKSDDTAFNARSGYSSLLLIYQEVISRSRKYQDSFVSELRNQELKRLRRLPQWQPHVPTTRFGSSVSKPFEILNPEMRNPEAIFEEADRQVERQLNQYFPLRNPLDAELQQRFAIDPISVLTEMGAEIGGHRNIKTLYRVRDVHMESLPGEQKPAIITFGYPIFVSSL